MFQALDDYLELEKQIFAYFGYVEDWRVLPIKDSRQNYWRIHGGDSGRVRFSEDEALLDSSDADYYEEEIYTQRHLPRWVYRGAEYTMISVDTRTDGNQLLRIFDNIKERP